ncbi:MAG: ABC transporter substrate-binding protein [Candidatus Melainabacteria bacterium]|nr:ABC transporter substrate-binding protein [Candidatus Melainabacteria bacterium]
MQDLRIISLIASATETLHRLGLLDNVVGRSHECDYPASILDLPVCTSPKFEVDETSYEIDQKVKALVQEGLSVYRVDAEKIKSLNATHIVTQIQCEVCAVSQKDVIDACSLTLGEEVKIISLKPDSFSDILSDIDTLGIELGIESRGLDLIEEITEKIEILHKDCARFQAKTGRAPRIACIEWIEPLMAAGNWVPELIEFACGENLFGEAGKHSPWMNMDDLAKSDPDVVLVTPCGFDIERTMQEMHLLLDNPQFKSLSCLSNKRVYVADGNQYFNRPGPRIVESMQMLAEMLYPDHYSSGLKGKGFIQI